MTNFENHQHYIYGIHNCLFPESVMNIQKCIPDKRNTVNNIPDNITSKTSNNVDSPNTNEKDDFPQYSYKDKYYDEQVLH